MIVFPLKAIIVFPLFCFALFINLTHINAMKKGLSALLLASLLCASSGCQQNQKEVVNEYNIVPMPNQMTPQEGRFQLSNKVSVATAGCTPEVQAIADSLIARIQLKTSLFAK